MKDKFKKATTASTERQKAILRRWAFNLFLKSVMSETVRRKSAGRERERERERERVPCRWTGDGEVYLLLTARQTAVI